MLDINNIILYYYLFYYYLLCVLLINFISRNECTNLCVTLKVKGIPPTQENNKSVVKYLWKRIKSVYSVCSPYGSPPYLGKMESL